MIKMSDKKTFKTDGIAISSFTIYQSTPVSIGCVPCLISVF